MHPVSNQRLARIQLLAHLWVERIKLEVVGWSRPQPRRPHAGTAPVLPGASDDERFHTFETTTGRMLWETRLGAAAHATPITHRGKSGRQCVSIVAAAVIPAAAPTSPCSSPSPCRKSEAPSHGGSPGPAHPRRLGAPPLKSRHDISTSNSAAAAAAPGASTSVSSTRSAPAGASKGAESPVMPASVPALALA